MFTFLLLPGLCGCGGSEVADAHDDHHLEHFVPHQKPANYATAVEEIEHRAEHLSDHAGHGHADEADEFQELLAKQPNSVPGHMGMATLLEIQKKHPEAKAEYLKVLELQPDQPASAPQQPQSQQPPLQGSA